MDIRKCIFVIYLVFQNCFRFVYKSESGLKLEIFHHVLDRLKGNHKHYGSSYLEESLNEKKLDPYSTSPACKKVCGGWLGGWVLNVDFSVKF